MIKIIIHLLKFVAYKLYEIKLNQNHQSHTIAEHLNSNVYYRNISLNLELICPILIENLCTRDMIENKYIAF